MFLNRCTDAKGSSQSSSSTAIRRMIHVAERKDEIDQKGGEDEDSARGRSVTTGSDEGSSKSYQLSNYSIR